VFMRELVQAFPCNDMHYRGATLSKAFSNEKLPLRFSLRRAKEVRDRRAERRLKAGQDGRHR